MGFLKDPSIRARILACLRDGKKLIFAEALKDYATMEDRTGVTYLGVIELAIKRLESSQKLKRVILRNGETAYKWHNFKMKGSDILFKVVFEMRDGEEKLIIISCKLGK